MSSASLSCLRSSSRSARASTRIAVLDQGRLVESGTHAEVMAGRELYWRMFTQQSSRCIENDTSQNANS